MKQETEHEPNSEIDEEDIEDDGESLSAAIALEVNQEINQIEEMYQFKIHNLHSLLNRLQLLLISF